jgi:iron complex outermembrane recepter protein
LRGWPAKGLESNQNGPGEESVIADPRITACARLLACVLAGADFAAPAQEEPPPEPGTVNTVPLRAQDPGPAPPSGAVQLDEVTVTAQRRRESLQETPISVSAFGPAKLEARGIDNILDLGSHVPGMQIEPFPINMATLRIFIRGIGALDAQVTQDPAVGVYLDGVYLGRSVGLAFDVADLERIEVLRGPQGTLYGRNTTGGAINLITRRPSTSGFEMTHKFTLGDRNHAAGRSMVNVPLGDRFAAKLAVLSSHKDGYVENIGPGEDFGDRDDVSSRLDLRWDATDWLTADYAFDYTNIEYVQYMYQAILTPETHHGQAEDFKRYAQSQTIYSHDRLDAMSSGAPMQPSIARIRGHAVNLAADLGDFGLPGVEVKYTGALRELIDKAYPDLSGGLDVSGGRGNPDYRLDPGRYDGPATRSATLPKPILRPIPLSWLRTFQDQTSHELQVLGDLWDDQLRYIAGVFLYEENGFDDRCGSAGDFCAEEITHQFHTGLLPVPTSIPLPNGTNRVSSIVHVYRTDIHNESRAYFTQLTWSPAFAPLERRLHLTLGFRHTEDDREALKNYDSRVYAENTQTDQATDITDAAGTCRDPQRSTGISGNDVFDNVRVARSFANDSFSFIAAWDLTPAINTYAKYVQAYKSGGFDTRDPQITGDQQSSDCETYHIGFTTGFAPEFVDSIEGGFKSEWLDRALRVNLNLFHMDFHDRQISALLQGAIQDTKTRNIGRSEMMGVELETAWAIRHGLTASLEYEYLHARTLEVLDFEGNNVADNYQPYSAPNNSWVAALDWTIREFAWGQLNSYLNYNYVDKRNGQTLPNRRGLTALGQYGVLGARVGLANMPFWQRGRADVALWGRNLLDEEYEYSAIDNLPHADRSVIWAEPRTYGLDFIYRWN